MKKILVLALIGILFMVGCSTQDPFASISESDAAVVTVDGNSYTRGQFYDALVSTNATALVTNKLIDLMYENIIGDESVIIDQVNEILAQLKSGDESYFKMYLNYMGYTSEESYVNDMILFSKQDALVGKYIEDNYDQYFDEYQPKMVRMLQSSDKDKAEEALALIKDGADFIETTTAYGNGNYNGQAQLIHNFSTNVSNNVLLAIQSYNEPAILDAVVVNVEGTLFTVIEITDIDSTSLKDAFTTNLKQEDTVIDTAIASYVRAGNFTVYDKNVYDALNQTNPNFLDQ